MFDRGLTTEYVIIIHHSSANKTKCQEMRSVKWSFLCKQWTLTQGCHFLDNLKSRLSRERLSSSMTPKSFGGFGGKLPQTISKLRSSTCTLAEKVQTTNSLTFRMLSQLNSLTVYANSFTFRSLFKFPQTLPAGFFRSVATLLTVVIYYPVEHIFEQNYPADCLLA